MPRVLQIAIDAETEQVVAALEEKLGWNDARIVREGIHSLQRLLTSGRKRKIVGIGKIASGRSALASNKAHLAGFGR